MGGRMIFDQFYTNDEIHGILTKGVELKVIPLHSIVIAKNRLKRGIPLKNAAMDLEEIIRHCIANEGVITACRNEGNDSEYLPYSEPKLFPTSQLPKGYRQKGTTLMKSGSRRIKRAESRDKILLKAISLRQQGMLTTKEVVEIEGRLNRELKPRPVHLKALGNDVARALSILLETSPENKEV
jgi:hypothetical protein